LVRLLTLPDTGWRDNIVQDPDKDRVRAADEPHPFPANKLFATPIPVGQPLSPKEEGLGNAAGRELVGRLRAHLEDDGTYEGVAISPDGTLIAGAGPKDLITLWDAASGTKRGTLLGGVKGVAFTADGQWIIGLGRYQSGLAIWETSTGRLLRNLNTPAREMAVTPDKRLVTLARNGTLALWISPTASSSRNTRRKAPANSTQ